jgi:hypothetical protein
VKYEKKSRRYHMSGSKIKPTRWYYGLALLIPILACGLTAFLVYRKVPKLPGALDAIGIKNLTQVVVPGSAEIAFPKAGAYAVYYEYRSVIDGVNYVRDKYPPSINCTLKSKATGAEKVLAPDYIEGNMYSTQNQERVGVLIKSIGIEKPGVYIFSCQYRDGRTQPKIVLAVGPNIIYEFFNIAVKPIAASICGGFVFVGSLGISILIIGIVAFKRHQSKNALGS